MLHKLVVYDANELLELVKAGNRFLEAPDDKELWSAFAAQLEAVKYQEAKQLALPPRRSDNLTI